MKFIGNKQTQKENGFVKSFKLIPKNLMDNFSKKSFLLISLLFCSILLNCVLVSHSKVYFKNKGHNSFHSKFQIKNMIKNTNSAKLLGQNFLYLMYKASNNNLEFVSNNFREKRRFKTLNKASLKRLKFSLSSKIKKYKALLKRYKHQSAQKFSRISDLSQLNKSARETAGKYTQFRYYKYQEIVSELEKLAKVEGGKWVKLTTAQKDFDLPSPGGYCGQNKE